MPNLSTYPPDRADWATICAWIDANNPTLSAALAADVALPIKQ